MSMGKLRIAIDGPAGAGKSTVAKAVARQLGILYVDTGSMYRAVAWLILHHDASMDEDDIVSLLERDPIRFEQSGDKVIALWRDQDITSQLRSVEVSNIVSQVSAHPNLRQHLTKIQRDFGEHHSVVMDGRDIGTVVLPDAEIKVFLTADLATRAARRAKELESEGVAVSTGEMERAIAARDQRDSQRDIAPLTKADDAHYIDTSGLTIEDVVARIVRLIESLPNSTVGPVRR